MPLYRRLPKRGFVNIFKKNFNIFNLSQIQSLLDKKKIEEKEEITNELLLKKNIIKKKLNGLKILGKGEIKTKISIQAIKASKNAVKKIDKIGGKINIIKLEKKVKIKDSDKKNINENELNKEKKEK